MTCKDCEKHEECNKNKTIKFEIYNSKDGWHNKLHYCNYVECICKEYKPKGE